MLVHFENSAHPRGHYVVVTSINGNEIIAKDPAGGKVSNVNIKICRPSGCIYCKIGGIK